MRRWQRALDFLYPTRCLVCEVDFAAERSPLVCAECARAFAPPPPPACERCGQWFGPGALACAPCSNCAGRSLDFAWAVAMGRYEGRLRDAIHRFKFFGLDLLARVFAEGMAEALRGRDPQAVWPVIVPVPASRASWLFPERNPAALLAKELALRLKSDCREAGLRKRRATLPQAQLARPERLANLAGSMEAVTGSWVVGKSVLIVDDILTTGATASEAARALRAAGASTCHVVAIAR